MAAAHSNPATLHGNLSFLLSNHPSATIKPRSCTHAHLRFMTNAVNSPQSNITTCPCLQFQSQNPSPISQPHPQNHYRNQSPTPCPCRVLPLITIAAAPSLLPLQYSSLPSHHKAPPLPQFISA
ncbi:hypothetical protein M0R45_030451 [Rubus argutus]|uniref:Uncharacterized protein n=1 Tax=Rubus argutus TaxID=59490 RepID=A0AAW1WEQ7_RUBAR